MRRLAFFLVVGSLFGSGAFAGSAEEIKIADGFVSAVPPTAANSAAYFAISNSSDKAVRLVGAETDIAKVAELHRHVHENGRMKMEKLGFIEIPAKGSVELEPMGDHVMLIGLKKSFFRSKTVNLRLTFSNGHKESVELPIRKVE